MVVEKYLLKKGKEILVWYWGFFKWNDVYWFRYYYGFLNLLKFKWIVLIYEKWYLIDIYLN